MAPRAEDDWSDSDDEELGGVETTVLLGVPDGPIDAASDINDVAVSRIGGRPVRAILNVQLYVVLTNLKGLPRIHRASVRFFPMQSMLKPNGAARPDVVSFRGQPDGPRPVYLGLSKSKLPGEKSDVRIAEFVGHATDRRLRSVRAWRGLRHNEKYAAKLEIKLAKKRERERAKAEALAKEAEKKAAAKVNPFSVSPLLFRIKFAIERLLADEFKRSEPFRFRRPSLWCVCPRNRGNERPGK